MTTTKYSARFDGGLKRWQQQNAVQGLMEGYLKFFEKKRSPIEKKNHQSTCPIFSNKVGRGQTNIFLNVALATLHIFVHSQLVGLLFWV